MTEVCIRFTVGGLFVSVFALVGDVLKPKSFAGLFGAAPSVALYRPRRIRAGRLAATRVS